MLLLSKTLAKEIDFATFEKTDEFGKPIKIIYHDSLQSVIHDAKVKYDFTFVSADPAHSVVVCSMADNSGRIVREVGESIPVTLDTEIAKNYPSLIASQRAFDRAAIRYLDLPGKVFSNLEIPILEIEDTVAQTTTSNSGVISSIVQEEENADFTVDVNTDDFSIESGIPDNEEVIDGVSVNVSSNDDLDLPFDAEVKEEEDPANHVVTMSGKYGGKNKTVAEIYAMDAGWATWIAANFTPRNPVAEKDVAAIKKYVALMGGK